MATGCFLAQYFVPDPAAPQRRRCRIEAHRALIVGDGGKLAYRECLGDQAVVGVSGVTVQTLATIDSDPIIRRFPGVNQPSDNLGQLTDGQWTNYRDFAVSLGYPAAEWDARFPAEKANYTLRDVMVFMVKRRLTPRFDTPTQAIVLDGSVVNQSAALINDLTDEMG